MLRQSSASNKNSPQPETRRHSQPIPIGTGGRDSNVAAHDEGDFSLNTLGNEDGFSAMSPSAPATTITDDFTDQGPSSPQGQDDFFDRGNSPEFDPDINPLEAREIVLRREQGTLTQLTIPYEFHVAQAFKAAREGNTRLLKVLLYDGLDHERDSILMYEEKGNDLSIKLSVLELRMAIISQQLTILTVASKETPKPSHIELQKRLEVATDKAIKRTEKNLKETYGRREHFWCHGARFNGLQDERYKEQFFNYLHKLVISAAADETLTLTSYSNWEIKTALLEKRRREHETLYTKLSDSRLMDSQHLDVISRGRESITHSEQTKQATLKALLDETPEQLPEEYRKANEDEALFNEICQANVLTNSLAPETGNTLLHEAVLRDHQEAEAARKSKQKSLPEAPTVVALMACFASPFIKNTAGVTAFEMAAEFVLNQKEQSSFCAIIDALEKMPLKRFMPFALMYNPDEQIQRVIEQYDGVKKVLNNYGKKLKTRTSWNVFWQYIYGYYKRLKPRINEWQQSYQNYTDTAKTADIIRLLAGFKIISENSPRGIRRVSALNDGKDAAADIRTYDLVALNQSRRQALSEMENQTLKTELAYEKMESAMLREECQRLQHAYEEKDKESKQFQELSERIAAEADANTEAKLKTRDQEWEAKLEALNQAWQAKHEEAQTKHEASQTRLERMIAEIMKQQAASDKADTELPKSNPDEQPSPRTGQTSPSFWRRIGDEPLKDIDVQQEALSESKEGETTQATSKRQTPH